jgi:hypothetical protein
MEQPLKRASLAALLKAERKVAAILAIIQAEIAVRIAADKEMIVSENEPKTLH